MDVIPINKIMNESELLRSYIGLLESAADPVASAIAQVYNSEEFWDYMMQHVGSGPFDGGCVVCAAAIQQITGGQLVAMVRQDDIAEHAAVLSNSRLYDFDGAGPVDRKINKFNRNEMASAVAVRPLRDTDLPDAPRNPAASDWIAGQIRNFL
jgi:hypothetical protein